MAGVVGKAIKGLGLLAKKKKTGWGAHLKRRSRVFKEGQDRMKGLEKQIKSGVVDRNVKSKDVFKIIKGLKK